MKFLKGNLKTIIAFFLGVILAGGIVYAATSAIQVSYSKEGLDVKNVEEALNDLYTKSNTPVFINSDSETWNGAEKQQSITVNDMEVGAYYLCIVTHRKQAQNCTVTGAATIFQQLNSAFFDSKYGCELEYIQATSTRVTFSIPDTTGMGVTCYKLERQ